MHAISGTIFVKSLYIIYGRSLLIGQVRNKQNMINSGREMIIFLQQHIPITFYLSS